MNGENESEDWNQEGTTPRAQALGQSLRRVREGIRVSLRDIGARIGVSHTTISRWESGERAPGPVQVANYLASLGATPTQRNDLIAMADEIAHRHWLATDPPDLRRQVQTLQEMENEATRIVSFSQLLIPGQLQIEEYARAIMDAGDISDADSAELIAARTQRRHVITRPHPVQLIALIDRSALDRNIGGPEVMLAQVRFLLARSELSNVELRIVPIDRGWHPGLAGEFVLMEFQNRSPIVFYTNRSNGHLLHRPSDVAPYAHTAERIQQVALGVEQSYEIIRGWIAEQEDTA